MMKLEEAKYNARRYLSDSRPAGSSYMPETILTLLLHIERLENELSPRKT